MAAEETGTKELWGSKLSIVPESLSEEQVVSFVNDLMTKSKQPETTAEKQASLLKLAEQTVVEADKLAESIKERARQEAEAEAARIVADGKEKAQEEGRQILQAAQKEAEAQSNATGTKAEEEAKETIRRAQRDAQSAVDAARDRVTSIEDEAKLAAEFIVRRTTPKVAEGIRKAVTKTCDDLLPSVEDSAKELRKTPGLDEAEERPTSRAKGKASSRR